MLTIPKFLVVFVFLTCMICASFPRGFPSSSWVTTFSMENRWSWKSPSLSCWNALDSHRMGRLPWRLIRTRLPHTLSPPSSRKNWSSRLDPSPSLLTCPRRCSKVWPCLDRDNGLGLVQARSETGRCYICQSGLVMLAVFLTSILMNMDKTCDFIHSTSEEFDCVTFDLPRQENRQTNKDHGKQFTVGVTRDVWVWSHGEVEKRWLKQLNSDNIYCSYKQYFTDILSEKINTVWIKIDL